MNTSRSLVAILVSVFLLQGSIGVPLEPTKANQDPLTVVDIPADPVEDVPSPEEKTVPVAAPAEKETPNRPTILIIQRRPLFPFFSNPFSSMSGNFPRPRPVFGGLSSEEDEEPIVRVRPSDDSFDSVMTRLHSQMSSLWDSFLAPPPHRRRPVNKDQSSEETSDNRPVFPTFSFPQFQFPKFPAFPEIFKADNSTKDEQSLNNSTTSETKTVDGHLVTVNSTRHVIKDKDNKTSGFFQFQVINVRPTPPQETKTETEAVEPPKPVDYDTNTSDKKVEVEVPNPSFNEVVAPKKVSGVDDGLLE